MRHQSGPWLLSLFSFADAVSYCASHVTHLLCLALGLPIYLLSFTLGRAKSFLGRTLRLACFVRGLALHLLLHSLPLVLGFLTRASHRLLDLFSRLLCITSAYIIGHWERQTHTALVDTLHKIIGDNSVRLLQCVLGSLHRTLLVLGRRGDESAAGSSESRSGCANSSDPSGQGSEACERRHFVL